MILGFMFEAAQITVNGFTSTHGTSVSPGRAFATLLRGGSGVLWVVAAFSWYRKRWAWAVSLTLLGYLIGVVSIEIIRP